MNKDVSIIDYGVGNINSVANMLARAGAKVSLARTPQEVAMAPRLILPGVGAFDSCRRSLDAIPGLEESIHSFCASGRPMLGICVGMQLLGSSSEEGELLGLDIIPGTIRRFAFGGTQDGTTLKIPHMGWSPISVRGSNPLFGEGLADVNRFYFVHSYYFDANQSSDIAAECSYGLDFAASVRRDNVFGVQFHPEKSHRFGLQMFKNFVNVC
jgi:imidazole glycerol-phosphate synthase subunit HisH